MPRRQILSGTEKQKLYAVPTARPDLVKIYTFSESDLSLIRHHTRKNYNRLNFAIQLCYARYPGTNLPIGEGPAPELLDYVCEQLGIDIAEWKTNDLYIDTRQDHLAIIRNALGLDSFAGADYRQCIDFLGTTALRTNSGIVLSTELIEYLRRQRILLPSIDTVERICAQAITKAERTIYALLTNALTDGQKTILDKLLSLRQNEQVGIITWLRQSPSGNNARNVLEHLERLNTIKELNLPDNLDKQVHQNRLLKMAREGAQMSTQHLNDLEPARRYATLVAILLETRSTLIDELVEMHDKIIGNIFARAKNRHAETFQKSGREINDKLRKYVDIGSILLESKITGNDPFAQIEALMGWQEFEQSVSEAKALSQPGPFDSLALIGRHYAVVRRYAPDLFGYLEFRAAPTAVDILTAVDVLKKLDVDSLRKVPHDAPTSFIRKRWQELVFTDDGINRKYYEMAVFAELKNALRSGDIWVKNSRQFKDFEEYLLPRSKMLELKENNQAKLLSGQGLDIYLGQRIALLEERLAMVNGLAAKGELIDVTIGAGGLKITPLTDSVPKEAELLKRKLYDLLPRIKITDLLMEVDGWTGFTKHFTHLKTGEASTDKTLLLSVILSDALNLGLTKMADSCSGTTYSKLSWLQAWYIRDETYGRALSELVNTQLNHPFSSHWGDGRTSSSDGQRFAATDHARETGRVNPKYGTDPGVQFYTHVSDQYMPFHTKVINVGVRDATYVLDGLLHHESDLRIEEHYTDTSGFTDHIFALTHLLDFRFAPRIRDINDKKLYVPNSGAGYPHLDSLIGGKLNIDRIRDNWDDICRLALSIGQGVVTASLIIKKIGSYPRQNGTALALKELGKLERTIFMLDWFMDPELRRRVTAGLNKGEARNTLSRAVFMHRLGEVRENKIETQHNKASGLTSATAAIAIWNTVYLDMAKKSLERHGVEIDEKLLPHISPLGWEHINLAGDYSWGSNNLPKNGKFRPLRPHKR